MPCWQDPRPRSSFSSAKEVTGTQSPLFGGGFVVSPFMLQDSTNILFRNDFTVEPVSVSGDDDSVLRAMLISTLKDDSVSEMSPEAKLGRINFLMSNRHGTPFEHNQLIFRVEAPIFVYREWHRHRIGISINEQSGRYSELPPMFYVPPQERPLVQTGKPGAYQYVEGSTAQWLWLCEDIEAQAWQQYTSYQERLERGYAKEIARISLGVNIYSAMYWTCNARSLMAFLSLRTRDDDAMFPSKPMWEIDACARMAEEVFAAAFPLTHQTFNDNRRVAP